MLTCKQRWKSGRMRRAVLLLGFPLPLFRDLSIFLFSERNRWLGQCACSSSRIRLFFSLPRLSFLCVSVLFFHPLSPLFFHSLSFILETCPYSCSPNGVCNPWSGQCDCSSGFFGTLCNQSQWDDDDDDDDDDDGDQKREQATEVLEREPHIVPLEILHHDQSYFSLPFPRPSLLFLYCCPLPLFAFSPLFSSSTERCADNSCLLFPPNSVFCFLSLSELYARCLRFPWLPFHHNLLIFVLLIFPLGFPFDTLVSSCFRVAQR